MLSSHLSRQIKRLYPFFNDCVISDHDVISTAKTSRKEDKIMLNHNKKWEPNCAYLWVTYFNLKKIISLNIISNEFGDDRKRLFRIFSTVVDDMFICKWLLYPYSHNYCHCCIHCHPNYFLRILGFLFSIQHIRLLTSLYFCI